MNAKRLECRITIDHNGRTFLMGMYDPISGRHEPLGEHPTANIEQVVSDLRVRMEKERHIVTYSEVTAPR